MPVRSRRKYPVAESAVDTGLTWRQPGPRWVVVLEDQPPVLGSRVRQHPLERHHAVTESRRLSVRGHVFEVDDRNAPVESPNQFDGVLSRRVRPPGVELEPDRRLVDERVEGGPVAERDELVVVVVVQERSVKLRRKHFESVAVDSTALSLAK